MPVTLITTKYIKHKGLMSSAEPDSCSQLVGNEGENTEHVNTEHVATGCDGKAVTIRLESNTSCHRDTFCFLFRC